MSFAHSAEDALRAVEDSAKRKHGNSIQSSLETVADQPSKLSSKRVKIVISIQDKNGLKQFRMYMVYLRARILELFTRLNQNVLLSFTNHYYLIYCQQNSGMI